MFESNRGSIGHRSKKLLDFPTYFSDFPTKFFVFLFSEKQQKNFLVFKSILQICWEIRQIYWAIKKYVGKTLKIVIGPAPCSLPYYLLLSLQGRGVSSSRRICKGEFVVEYSGDLIDVKMAKERETKYAMDLSKGCYMYYFRANNRQYW